VKAIQNIFVLGLVLGVRLQSCRSHCSPVSCHHTLVLCFQIYVQNFWRVSYILITSAGLEIKVCTIVLNIRTYVEQTGHLILAW